MRTYKIYILAMSLVVFAGCKKDFLDVEDLTSVTEQNFYKTPNDGFSALVGCYDGLQRAGNSSSFIALIGETLSDNAFGGTGNADGFGFQMIDEFDKQRSPADVSFYSNNWNTGYAAIYRCNMLISKIGQIEWGSNTALKSQYEAEARFLRAYLYFDLVRLFGNIPLITEPTTENVPQANPEEVYKLIASDLEFAAANLPAVTYAAQPAADRGRVTKWAAESLIGRVFLYYTGYYAKPDLAGVTTKAEALTYLEDVISNSGHSLVPDFANLWPVSGDNYAGENNIETVFAIKYTYLSDYNGNLDGNHWMVMNGIRGVNFFPYGAGWGANTVNPKLWNAYAANDSRKAASIVSLAGESIPFGTKERADQREYTGYTNKKYTPLSNPDNSSTTVGKGEGSFMISQYQDYVSIRYADVLLMAAELESPKAQQYFDEVRQRAYKSNYVAQAVSKANILNERRFEFAGEGVRYWDLLRQGVSVAASTIAENNYPVLNGGIAATKTILASKINETKGLQQIPDAQIKLSNGVLKQNIGW